MNIRYLIALIFLLTQSLQAIAENVNITTSKIEFVAINGGADAPNPGTTCVKLSTAVPASCTGGMLAIGGNNKELISAALAAKATGGDVWLHYNNSSSPQHCPGLVFTNCTISSIGLK